MQESGKVWFDMAEKVTEFFGIDVFNEAVMRERLPKTTFKALKKTMENGEEWLPHREACETALSFWR